MFPQHKLASGKKGNTCPLIWKKFRNITQIGDYSPQLVEWTGSVANAEKWDRLIHFLARRAMDDAETGYITQLLTDEDGFWLKKQLMY